MGFNNIFQIINKNGQLQQQFCGFIPIHTKNELNSHYF